VEHILIHKLCMVTYRLKYFTTTGFLVLFIQHAAPICWHRNRIFVGRIPCRFIWAKYLMLMVSMNTLE
jgi:hypothetical protein